jgi:C1A family cysteine protease
MQFRAPMNAASTVVSAAALAMAAALPAMALAAGGRSAEGPALEVAPQNPAFVKWRERQQEKRREARGAEDGAGRFGTAPPPRRYPDLSGPATELEAMVKAGLAEHPASYDLRGLGLVTPVRDQSPFGTCWAFAAYASMESNIMKALGAAVDFSEWHTVWFAFNPVNGMPAFTQGRSDGDPVFDLGGNSSMVTALATRGTGPVREELAPYQNTDGYTRDSLPSGLEPSAATIGSVYSFQKCDQGAIKGLIQTHGALAVSMLWPEKGEGFYYNYEKRAFRYVQQGDFELNHGVCIVGWDDAFPRDRFPASNRPETDGAWIVRNSWGDIWGDGGYFYMSYDTSLEYFDSFIGSMRFDAEPYQYDHLGLVGGLGYTGSSTAWFSNIFTAPCDDALSDVAFYTNGASASYEISVRTGVTAGPDTGALAFGPQKGTLELPGYHRIRLLAPVGVGGGQKFAVIVKLTEQQYKYPIPIQYPYEGYSDSAKAQPGAGFISYNGASWQDVKSAAGLDNVSICLKAIVQVSVAEAPDGCSPTDPQLLGFGAAHGDQDPRYDLNGDGKVDDVDLQALFRWMVW